MHAFIGEFYPTLKKNNINSIQTLPENSRVNNFPNNFMQLVLLLWYQKLDNDKKRKP